MPEKSAAEPNAISIPSVFSVSLSDVSYANLKRGNWMEPSVLANWACQRCQRALLNAWQKAVRLERCVGRKTSIATRSLP